MQVGVYDASEGFLVDSFRSEQKTSDALPVLFKEILAKYICNNIVYARGPGSFMAIKITYIFLRTLAITRKINLLGSDGFLFTNNEPISAMKNLAFMKNKDGLITTEVISKDRCGALVLPEYFDFSKYSEDIEPLYILPAV